MHIVGSSLAILHFKACAYSCSDTSTSDGPCNNSSAGVAIAIGLPLSIGLVVVLGLEPLSFWKKSTHAFSLLLPSLLFCVAFLCPRMTGTSPKLATEISSGPDASIVITATSIVLVLSVIGFSTQTKHFLTESSWMQLAVFIFIFAMALVSLLATRVIQRSDYFVEQETENRI